MSSMIESVSVYPEELLFESIDSTVSHELEEVSNQVGKNMFPGLSPHYNGKCLNIHPELTHAALAGISIKHYYGKCEIVASEEEEKFFEEPAEGYGFSLFGSDPSIGKESIEKNVSSTESGGFEYRDDSINYLDAKPLCAQYRINFRNSFWNLHQPELSKLTWPQKYVSAATVTDHLHEHLVTHGAICEKFHDKKDRIEMLNKELDEYGRLKEIAPPRKLPTDDKLFNFKQDENKVHLITPDKCVPVLRSTLPKFVIEKKDRIFSMGGDKLDSDIREIHRSKAEFCLTIGKPVTKLTMSPSISTSEQENLQIIFRSPAEEEGDIYFYYTWPWFEEEALQEGSAFSTLSDMEAHLASSANDCPPLMMDDFCRAAAKADFSDLRCNPDL